MHTQFVSKATPSFALCLQAKSLTGLYNEFLAGVESEQMPADVVAAAHAAYDAVKKVDLLLADKAVAAHGGVA
jgi:hypothetical protein